MRPTQAQQIGGDVFRRLGALLTVSQKTMTPEIREAFIRTAIEYLLGTARPANVPAA